MRRRNVICVVLNALPVLLVGCETPPPRAEEEITPDMTTALATMEMVEAAERAVIRQGTIYDHHFVPETAVLSALGERDLRILAAHHARYPGSICVMKGGTSDGLYEARVSTVRYELERAGIPPDRVTIARGLPGGDGIGSTEARAVLETMREPDAPREPTSDSYGFEENP